MKVIISHDVDHLYSSDHWMKDLFLPKLFVRSVLQWTGVYGEKISASECGRRCLMVFRRTLNHIKEIAEFDHIHGVSSTFFFGMANGWGMSYKRDKAGPFIIFLNTLGFGVGVHGICNDDLSGIMREYSQFAELTGFEAKGIRMHYARFEEQMLHKLSDAGYLFDSTEFDKKTGACIKAPYKVGHLWEFPITIMDSYLPYGFEKAKKRTIEIIKEAEKGNIKYISILCHDTAFCSAWEQTERWYRWLIEYLIDNGYGVTSYLEAVNELEKQNER